ncbi:hypothetical protein BDY21DRAFT_286936 [Lineolata rhizophorae]|uniref:DUF7924 domain-containing protein n=1 Tax=Lineolata rhizophorae TaxID=578093 RepID=A0A6A6NZG6_9PEZI|nr:hypothetical protein BDY21DRAFT_286936 [Lineolata rhizophorae]
MKALLARKRSSSSLCKQEGSPTPSDRKPREVKNTQYTHPDYPTMLETRGFFMRRDRKGVSQESKDFCRTLLETDQEIPEDSLFRDDLFEATCEELQNSNEAKVIQDIARLIVPSARHLAIRGVEKPKVLTESVNEGWNNSIPLADITRPQPDYAVGFGRSAFAAEQLNKPRPFVGEPTNKSFFMATYYMHFPFLTCEVKGGTVTLDIADRQNAHSTVLAVSGVVQLFNLVGRIKELDRQILAFLVSYDQRTVRIYGHYPVIEEMVTYYRYPIYSFDSTAHDGKEKWTAYKFTKNVYDVWMPEHFKRLCSAIDQLPAGFSFELPEQSKLQFQDSALPQGL